MITYSTIESMMEPLFANGSLSNKEKIKPSGKVRMLSYEPYWGWGTQGYPFKDFLADCYHLLGESSKLEGMQQLIHHYYLQNGTLDAKGAVDRIKRFLGL